MVNVVGILLHFDIGHTAHIPHCSYSILRLNNVATLRRILQENGVQDRAFFYL